MLLDYDSLDQPKHPRIIRLSELIQRVGYGKTKIYDLMKKGEFPQKAKQLHGSRTAGWFEDDIDAYIESRRDNRPQLWKNDNCAFGSDDRIVHPEIAQQQNAPPKKEVIKPYNARIAKPNPHPQEQGLIATGMQLGGQTVYFHPASGKFLLDLGRALAPFLSAIAA